MQVRYAAWHGAEWQHFLGGLNAICAEIMAQAHADPDIMRVNRYCQERRAFTLYIRKYRSTALVQQYQQCCKLRVPLWKTVLKATLNGCLESFVEAHPVKSPELYFNREQYLQFLVDMPIGGMLIAGQRVAPVFHADSGGRIRNA